jgi:hypothetical protein
MQPQMVMADVPAAVFLHVCPACVCVQSLFVENLMDVWQASEDYSAPQLAKRCVLFALEHVTEIILQYGGGAVSSIGGAAATATAAAVGAVGRPARSGSAASSSSQCTNSQGSPCSSSGSQGGSLVSNSAGAAAFAQLMARMVPALRTSLVEDIKQAAVQAEVKPEEAT